MSETFIAKCAWGNTEVPIAEHTSIFGVEGFAIHRQLDGPDRFTPYFVVSHIASGLRMPGHPTETPGDAVKSCAGVMGSRKISRSDLEKKIAQVSTVDGLANHIAKVRNNAWTSGVA